MTQHLVEILTPLHIGTGNNLKYDYDYLIENGKVLVVDQHSLLQQLMTQDFETLKELTAKITKLSELKPILGTLEQGAGYQLAPFSKASSLPKGIEIRAQIKDAFFRPYLPGSSIKGAIRTALLAEMINKEGLEKIKEFLPKKKEKHPDQNLVHHLFSNTVPISSGKIANFDFLRAFQISDAFFETRHLGFTDIRWLNIDSRGDSPKPKWKNMSNRRNEAFKDWQQASGIFVESLLPATTGLLTWQVDEFLLNDKKAQQVLKWQNLPDFSTFERLRDLLNAHAKERLLEEKAFLDKYDVPKAFAQCQKLLQKVENESEACYLQVGWGNGWCGMTGGWMDKWVKEDMCDLYGLGKKGVDIFPKTRRLIVHQDSPCLPFGWIRIYPENVSSTTCISPLVTHRNEASYQWVETALQEIQELFHYDLRGALFSKQLAEHWQRLTEETLRKAVLEEIKQRWQSFDEGVDWWEKDSSKLPTAGKKAKKIYEQG